MKSKIFAMAVGVFLGTIVLTLLMSCSSRRFEEVGYYQKQAGNGSYHRVYSVYVASFNDEQAIWQEMKAYGHSQMHSERGLTQVFFFTDRSHTPDVTLTGDFPESLDSYCVAGYWHEPSGGETFEKYPFKKK